MLDTFKERLKAKLPDLKAQNLTEKRLNAIADRLHNKFPDLTEEADYDAKIDELNDLTPFAEIAKQDDRIRTLEKNPNPLPKKKPTPPKKENDGEEEGSDDTDDTPAWAKALIEQNKALATEVNNIKKEKALGSIKQKAAEKLKEVPERFWNKLPLPEKEDEIETFVADVQSDYTAFKQELVNQGFSQVTPPYTSTGGKTKEATKEELKAITDKIIK